MHQFKFGLWIGMFTVVATQAIAQAQTGTLKMQVVFDGQPLVLPNLNAGAGFCGAQPIPNERLLVDGITKGIKNVVVYVYTGRGGTKLNDVPTSDGQKKLLDNNLCRFEPHVLHVQLGDTFEVTNRDLVAHNVNLQFIKNNSQNLTIPANGKVKVQLTAVEPAPVPVVCNIHPWMTSYLLVTDHPFVGISDKDGNIEIKGLPTGNVVFRIFIEAAKGKLTGIKVNGKDELWENNRFTVKIKAGGNDLGRVEVPAKNF